MSKNPFGNMGNIMRQAQAMQDRLAKLQEQAATKVAEGSAGGGMVTVKANGAMEIVSVAIHPDALTSGDGELLQDMVTAASNDALRKVKDLMASEMKAITGGMPVPGLF
ncbi:MAG: YbaB/EbfC family nucleoid-associated protein [Nitrospira sp.]|nr:YbaB/EbfC family nucleoid-associated protein [Nitrospira sp.]